MKNSIALLISLTLLVICCSSHNTCNDVHKNDIHNNDIHKKPLYHLLGKFTRGDVYEVDGKMIILNAEGGVAVLDQNNDSIKYAKDF